MAKPHTAPYFLAFFFFFRRLLLGLREPSEPKLKALPPLVTESAALATDWPSSVGGGSTAVTMHPRHSV